MNCLLVLEEAHDLVDVVAVVGQHISRSILCFLRRGAAAAAPLTFQTVPVLLTCTDLTWRTA